VDIELSKRAIDAMAKVATRVTSVRTQVIQTLLDLVGKYEFLFHSILRKPVDVDHIIRFGCGSRSCRRCEECC
jgi:hypothetical protein